MSYPPQPRHGYEFAAFYGKNCHRCLSADERKTPEEAAHKKAAQYKWTCPQLEEESLPPVGMAYVHVVEDGFYVFATDDVKFTFPRSVQEWLDTPFEVHIERWKKERRMT